MNSAQESLLHQQEGVAICAKFAAGFEHFPKHLRAHTPVNVIDTMFEAGRAIGMADNVQSGPALAEAANW
jgi:hypothetical protein